MFTLKRSRDGRCSNAKGIIEELGVFRGLVKEGRVVIIRL